MSCVAGTGTELANQSRKGDDLNHMRIGPPKRLRTGDTDRDVVAPQQTEANAELFFRALHPAGKTQPNDRHQIDIPFP